MYAPERNLTALDSTPKYSFGMKTQVEKPNDTPAPDTYKIERSNTIILYHRSPKYTFGIRPEINKPNDTPGTILLFGPLTLVVNEGWPRLLSFNN